MRNNIQADLSLPCTLYDLLNAEIRCNDQRGISSDHGAAAVKFRIVIGDMRGRQSR